MDLLSELESLVVIAEDTADHDGSFQELLHKPHPMERSLPHAQTLKSTYLVKLEGPLGTASSIQELAGMLHLPQQVNGCGDACGDTSFCFVSGYERCAIVAAPSERIGGSFNPTFIRIDRAEKALSSNSAVPCLGYDATLPHHRAIEASRIFLPTQNQYPKLELYSHPILRLAIVEGGNIRTWGGKYKALVDGDSIVRGWAYKVTSPGHEDVLHYYETSQYEVVRCAIVMCDTRETVWGLTFRFTGVCDQVFIVFSKWG
ncbi:hypothetical protein BJX76DRAFT_366305 [Aspergillus varians]